MPLVSRAWFVVRATSALVRAHTHTPHQKRIIFIAGPASLSKGNRSCHGIIRRKLHQLQGCARRYFLLPGHDLPGHAWGAVSAEAQEL